jgi:uncharacterized protein (TIGR02391 family)
MTDGADAEGPPIRRGGFMSRQHVATETVRIIHAEGTEAEAVHEEIARIQPKSGFFDVEAPIREGDVVEVRDPGGGPDSRERRVVAQVRVNDHGPRMMQHTQVIWGEATGSRVVAAVRVLTFEDLHAEVQSACGDLLTGGRYEDAVQEALTSLEVRVKALAGLDGTGASLMREALGTAHPKLEVTARSGRSGEQEREGFLALFCGAMLALRGPDAASREHSPPQHALESLALASLLHRRLDVAEQRLG